VKVATVRAIGMGPRKIITGVGWVAIALLAVIGATSAIGQIPPGPNSYNSGFVDHPVMTLTHAVPGLIFMVLGPLQFVGGIRNRFLTFHRWSGRIFLVNSVFIGLSGFVIAVVFPFAGLNEQIAIFVFGGAFLVSAGMAYYRIRPREVKKHREWMIRVFSIGLGISTVRVLVGLLFAFTSLTQIDFFAWTFWAGFGGTWLIGEIWIKATRRPSFR